MDKEFLHFYAEIFCLSKPVKETSKYNSSNNDEILYVASLSIILSTE